MKRIIRTKKMITMKMTMKTMMRRTMVRKKTTKTIWKKMPSNRMIFSPL